MALSPVCRTGLLIGNEGLDTLAKSKVIVFGVGLSLIHISEPTRP